MLTCYARIVDEYYDNFNKPSNFSTAAFMKEIRRSYRLLFSDDSRARRYYMQKEQKRAASGGVIDPYLEELCTQKASEVGASKSSYSKTEDFPILAERLSIIQEHILRQTPNNLMMLWHDRRNLLQW